MGGDVDNEVDCGEPSEEDEATEGEGGTMGGWNGMDICCVGDVLCAAGSSMSQSAKIVLSKTVDCLHCSSSSKRKLSGSFGGLLCAEYMAEREGRDGKDGIRRRGNGERTEATRRGFIWRRAIWSIL